MTANEQREWLVRRALAVLNIWHYAYLYCIECATNRPSTQVTTFWLRKSLKMKTMGLIAHDKILLERS